MTPAPKKKKVRIIISKKLLSKILIFYRKFFYSFWVSHNIETQTTCIEPFRCSLSPFQGGIIANMTTFWQNVHFNTRLINRARSV